MAGYGPTNEEMALASAYRAEGKKECKRCERVLPLEFFTKDKHRKYGYSSRCRECSRPHRNYETNRRHMLKRNYGITPEQYASLRERQGGLCAVCRDPLPGGSKEHVDHDHATGQIRGITCHNCNQAIGHLKEDVRRAFLVVQYLRKNSK